MACLPNESSASKRPFTVVVEGNIGSGKTTFLDYLSRYNNALLLKEPVDKWRACNGHNLLELMYGNQAKWSFSFQSYVQLTMLQHHTARTNHPIKLMERSIHSARACFVEQMRKSGNIPAASVAVIDEWYAWARANCDIHVDLIVYLRTTPNVAYERTMQRCRPEEASVPLDYIKSIHQMHEDWLIYKKNFECPAPVMVLDANLDREMIHEEYNRCFDVFPKQSLVVHQ